MPKRKKGGFLEQPLNTVIDNKKTLDVFDDLTMNPKKRDTVENNLLAGMNELFSVLNKKEQGMVKDLFSMTKNKKLVTLKMENGRIVKRDVVSVKSNNMMGGATGDNCSNELQIVNQLRGQIQTATPGVQLSANNGMSGVRAARIRIEQLTTQLANTDPNDFARMERLEKQLERMIMISHTAERQQQEIDIVRRRECCNQARDICSYVNQYMFSGFALLGAYFVINLFKGAAGLVTAATKGLIISLFLAVVGSISAIVNAFTRNIPVVGGEVAPDAGSVLNTVTETLRPLLDNDQMNPVIDQMEELGYTTNFLAFMILFFVFMLISHSVRIASTADNISLGWTGISLTRGNVTPIPPPAPAQLPAPTPTENNQIEDRPTENNQIEDRPTPDSLFDSLEGNNQSVNQNNTQALTDENMTGGKRKKKTRKHGKKMRKTKSKSKHGKKMRKTKSKSKHGKKMRKTSRR
jgi:hypothetical protein